MRGDSNSGLSGQSNILCIIVSHKNCMAFVMAWKRYFTICQLQPLIPLSCVMLSFERIWGFFSLTRYEISKFLCSRIGTPIFTTTEREMKSGSFKSIAALIVKFILKLESWWDQTEMGKIEFRHNDRMDGLRRTYQLIFFLTVFPGPCLQHM